MSHLVIRVWTHIYITPLNGSGIDTALLALPANDGYAFTTMRAIGRTGVSELTLWISRKPQQKYRGREGDRLRGLIHLPLPTRSYLAHRRNPAETPAARHGLALPVGRIAAAIWHMLAGQR